MAMESVMLTIKFAIFLAMEVFVVATMVGALILGVYQIVKDKIRESRRLDEIVPETNPVNPTS
jgi:ABC-type proline/glycine betaine transport system permease subunit